jgi:hypothetical protein
MIFMLRMLMILFIIRLLQFTYVGDGCVRVWKDYTQKNAQNLVTAWQTVQGHKPGVRSMNAVVDWQQFRGFLVIIIFLLSIKLGAFSAFRN